MSRIWMALLVLTFSIAGIAQNTGKTSYFYKDYIITANDTIICQIDENSLDKAKISYSLPSQPDKTKNIKVDKVLELKHRFTYKNVDIDGEGKFLKVLTEGVVSLYSKEKKGKTRMSDEEKPSLTSNENAPARSTFFIGKNGKTTQLTLANFKTKLKDVFSDDESLAGRVDDLEFEELEFTLLNMVIRYNYRLENN